MKRMVILAAVVVLLGAGCSKKNSTAVNAGNSTSTTANSGSSGDNGYGGYGSSTGSSTTAAAGTGGLTGSVTNKGTVDATGKSAATIQADNDGGQYYFEPTFVKLSSGTAVKVTIKNVGSVQHTFTVDSLHVDEMIDPGKSVTVTVNLPAGSGSTRYYCRYHHGSGMQGAFTTT